MDYEEADKNALQKFHHGDPRAQHDAWYNEAETAGQLNVTQGLDGNAGYYYYDKDRSLAFHWDGDATQPIQVAQGGDHEIPSWEFSFLDFRPKWVIAGTRTSALAFQYACENWIDAKEDAR